MIYSAPRFILLIGSVYSFNVVKDSLFPFDSDFQRQLGIYETRRAKSLPVIEQFKTVIDPNAHIYVFMCQKNVRCTSDPNVRQGFRLSAS